jgi:hypothetical protein
MKVKALVPVSKVLEGRMDNFYAQCFLKKS